MRSAQTHTQTHTPTHRFVCIIQVFYLGVKVLILGLLAINFLNS